MLMILVSGADVDVFRFLMFSIFKRKGIKNYTCFITTYILVYIPPHPIKYIPLRYVEKSMLYTKHWPQLIVALIW